MTAVVYASEPDLPVDDYIRVVGNSDLGKGRPLADRDRVARMPGAKPFYYKAEAWLGLSANGNGYWMTRTRGA